MKTAGKRIVSVALALVLTLGLLPSVPGLVTEAAAAGVTDAFGFDTSAPDGFEGNDDNPYGAGKVALNPMTELFMAGSGVTTATYDATDTKTSNTVSQNALTDTTAGYLYVESVAFDPTGSGKNDHVAYIGLRRVVKDGYDLTYDLNTYCTYDAHLELWAVDAVTGRQYGEKVSLGSPKTLNWLIGRYDRYNMIGESMWDLYISITAGDRDGDGRDELYTYVPNAGDDPTIQQVDVNACKATSVATVCTYGNGLWKMEDYGNSYVPGLNNSTAARFYYYDSYEIVPQVDLIMGDPDKDNQDELTAAVSWNSTHRTLFENYGLQQLDCHVLFFADISNTPISIDLSGWNYGAIFADYGDLTGDGREDLLLTKSHDYTVLTYNGNGFTALAHNISYPGMFYSGSHSVCFAGNGMGQAESVFFSGVVFKLSSDNRLIPDEDFVLLQKSGGFDFNNSNLCQAVAGNFDGNTGGYEQIVYSQYSGDSVRTGFIYNNTLQQGNAVNPTIKALYDAVPGETSTSTDGHIFFTFAPVDIDNDTCFIEFRSKEYSLESPKILAILQAAPYFQDLEDYYYDATGSTTFGTSTGTGSGSGKSVTATANATAKLGGGVSFIVSFEAYVSVSMSTEWSREYSTSTTTEMEINFAGGQGENNVVILSSPNEVFTYDAYQPDGNGGFEKGEMVVVVPQPCQYKTLTVEQYNAAAAVSGFAQITDEQVHAVPGQPASYYQANSGELNGLSNLVKHKTEPVSVTGSETAKVSKSITKTEESSITTTMSFATEIEAGVEISGSGVSGSIGAGGSTSGTTVDTSGITREVEVANVPGEGNGRYSFLWNMAIWNTAVGNQANVPVVGYILQNVKQPPSLPGAFTVSKTTQDSVTLGWEKNSSASAYEIYQYFANSTAAPYSKVATLSSDAEEYTISGLRAASSYDYVICSVNASGERSIYSAPVTAVTLPESGASPTIRTQPQDSNVIPGGNAVFTVSAMPAGTSGGLTYSWYESRQGGSVWTKVGTSNSTLTLPAVTTKMDGNNYRCIITQVIGGEQVMVYSDVATLSVGQGATSTTLSFGESNSGSADYTQTILDNGTEVTRPKTISVTVGTEQDAVTTMYTVYNTTSLLEGEKLYQSGGVYYVLENLVYNGGAYTADTAIPLSADPTFFATDEDGGTYYDEADPNALQGAEQGVFTIPVGAAAAGTTAGDYYVIPARKPPVKAQIRSPKC